MNFRRVGALNAVLGAPSRPQIVLYGTGSDTFSPGAVVEAGDRDDAWALAGADVDLVAASGREADKVYIARDVGGGFLKPQYPSRSREVGAEGVDPLTVVALSGSDTRSGPLEFHGAWMQPGLLLEGVWLDSKMSRMGAALLNAQTRLVVQGRQEVGEAVLCEDGQDGLRRLRARSTRALVAATVALDPFLALLVAIALRALLGLRERQDSGSLQGGYSEAPSERSSALDDLRSCPIQKDYNK